MATELVKGKVVIVAGGDRGVGRASAKLLSEQGARIVIVGCGCAASGSGFGDEIAQQLASDLRSRGGDAIAIQADLSTRGGAELMVEAAVNAFGGLDVLVNSADSASSETFLEVAEESWHMVLGALLDATFFSVQAAARIMRKNGGGRIVNTTHFDGLVGSYGQASRAAAAAGVYGLTRAASIELQRDGIIVNAVAPLTRAFDGHPESESSDAHQFTAEHVAPAVLLLSSELFGDRTGLVVGVAGSRVSVFRMTESQGRTKQARTPWLPEEIVEHWDSIAKLRPW